MHPTHNDCSHAVKMTAEDALRFLEHQARLCRDHDSHEALCLLPAAILKQFDLGPMDDFEAETFKFRLRQKLNGD